MLLKFLNVLENDYPDSNDFRVSWIHNNASHMTKRRIKLMKMIYKDLIRNPREYSVALERPLIKRVEEKNMCWSRE